MLDRIRRDLGSDRLIAWLLVVPPFVGVVFAMSHTGALSRSLDVTRAALAVSAAVALVGLLIRPGLAARVRASALRVWIPLAALFAVLIVAMALSGSATESLFGGTGRGLLSLAALVLVAVCAAALSNHVRHVLYLVVPPVLVIEIAATLWALTRNQEGQGTLANTVIYAQILLLIVPAALVPGPSVERRSVRLMRSVSAWGAILTLGLTGSRVGLVAGVGLLLFLAVQPYLGGRLSGVKRAKWPLIWASVAIAGLAVAAFTGPWRHKYTSMFSGEFFLSNRWAWWQTTWTSFLGSPLIGHGPDPYSFELVRLSREGRLIGFEALVGDPHNIFLTVLQVCGVLGLVLVIWIAVAVVRNWRSQGRKSIWLASGIVAALLTCLVEPLALQALPVFALILGASMAYAQPLEEWEESSAEKLTGTAMLAVTGVLSAYLVVYSVASLFAWLPQPSNADARSAQRVQLAADVVQLDPFLYYAASTGWWLAAQRDPSPILGEKAVVAMTRSTRLSPENPVYALQLARLYSAFGWPRETTKQAFERSIAVWPRNPEALRDYARYLASAGEADAARDVLRRFISVTDTASVPPDLAPVLDSMLTSPTL